MTAPGCPDASELASVLQGRVDGASFEALVAHIDACVVCQARVVKLGQNRVENVSARAAAWAFDATVPASDAMFADEWECLRVLARLEDVDPEAFAREVQRLASEGMPVLAGRYELLSEIGRGGMGVVYRARDLRLNREVAVKMIRRDVLPTREDVLRFRCEAEAAAALSHPHIVPIYEISEEDEAPFFAMPLMPGRTLAQVVAEGPLPPRLAAAHLRTIAQAVGFAHGRGIVHRDLKPANLMLDSAGIPRIGDFGLAKRVESDHDLTGTGQVLGTPSFMSPEQAEGRVAEVGPRSDIYALGATLYCLLTGSPPFQAASRLEVMRQVVSREPVPPRQLNRSVPRDLETICLKCLEKAPAHRYATAADLAADLDCYLGGLPIRARPLGWFGRMLKAAHRRPSVAALWIALVAVAIAGVSGILWMWLEAESRAAAERWEHYRAEMRVALSLLEDNSIVAARRALEEVPPDYRGWEWRHIAAQLDGSQATLDGFPSTVSAVAFAPSGDRLACASDHGPIRIWDLARGRWVARCEQNQNFVSYLAYVDGGRRLATSSDDHSVRLLDPATGAGLLLSGAGPTPWITTSPSGSRLVSWSNDGTVRVYATDDGRLCSEFGRGCLGAICLAVSPDERRVAGGTLTGKILLWNLDGSDLREIDTGLGQIDAITFSPDGRSLATGHAFPENTLALVDIPGGRLLRTGSGHTNSIHRVVFSADGRRIASCSLDLTARLWEAESLRPQAVLRGHSGALYSLSFSPDGRKLLTSGRDPSPRLWDVETADLIATLNGHQGAVPMSRFSPDGRWIATGSADQTVRLWETAALARNDVLRGHTSFVYDVAWSSDGTQLFSCGWDGSVRAWDLAGQRLVATRIEPDRVVSAVAASRDGRRLAVVRGDDRIEVLDPDLSHPGVSWKQSTRFWRRRPDLAFHPSGRWLVSGGDRGRIHLRDLDRGQEEILDAEDGFWNAAVAWSPDGRWIASGSESGVIHVWDARTRHRVAALRGHTRIITAMAFSPDSAGLASASEDGTARIWDVPHRRALAELPHGGIVHDIDFSPDGRRLATACDDHTIGLWDVSTRARLVELRGHHDYVHAVAFSPDGTCLASASGDQTVRLWDTLPPAERQRRGRSPKRAASP